MHCHICFRVDPTATLDVKPETPVEIALARHRTEVLNILSEYTDASDAQKLVKLLCTDSEDRQTEEFKKTLCSLSVDLVGKIVLDTIASLAPNLALNIIVDWYKQCF